MQKGNAFDMSIFLCSLLLGAGYDAYVCSGYARKQVTLMQASALQLDDLGQHLGSFAPQFSTSPWAEGASHRDASPSREGTQQSKYQLKPQPKLESAFLAKQEAKNKLPTEKEKESSANETQQQENALQSKSVEDIDPLEGLRVHAWVLVAAGKREIAESFFIEPSTGRIVDLTDPLYVGLESVFSPRNIWVNMQPCVKGLKVIQVVFLS